LEQENIQLKWELSKLKEETDQLRKAILDVGQDSGSA
jgi:hypothetical protein